MSRDDRYGAPRAELALWKVFGPAGEALGTEEGASSRAGNEQAGAAPAPEAALDAARGNRSEEDEPVGVAFLKGGHEAGSDEVLVVDDSDEIEVLVVDDSDEIEMLVVNASDESEMVVADASDESEMVVADASDESEMVVADAGDESEMVVADAPPTAVADWEANDEPSSLEVLYQRTVTSGEPAWLDGSFEAEFAETARLAAETLRPQSPPPLPRVDSEPTRRNADRAAVAAFGPVVPPRPRGGRRVGREVLRELSRVSERPVPLGPDAFGGVDLSAGALAIPAAASLPSLSSVAPITVGNRASVTVAPPARAAGSGRRWLPVVGAGAIGMALLAAAAIVAVRSPDRPSAARANLGELAATLAASTLGTNACEPRGLGNAPNGASCSAGASQSPFAAADFALTAAADPARTSGDGATGSASAVRGGAAMPAGSLPLGLGYVPSVSSSSSPEPEGATDNAVATTEAAEPDRSDTATELPQPATDTTAESPFDTASAQAALSQAAGAAAGACHGTEPGIQRVPVAVTFAPSGRATTAVVTGSVYQGTSVGGCIASIMKSAQVPAFSGGPVTVHRNVTLR